MVWLGLLYRTPHK